MAEQEVTEGSCSLCNLAAYDWQSPGSHGNESFNNVILHKGEELMVPCFPGFAFCGWL